MATSNLEPLAGRVRRIPGVKATKSAVIYKSIMILAIFLTEINILFSHGMA
jgi:hypothetical protein